MVPTLETERLVLRGHRIEDFAASAALWSDEAVVAHIGGQQSSPEEVWARLLRYAGHWAHMGFGYWLIERRTDRAFLGEIGFAHLRRGLGPLFDAAPEGGWALTPSAHGQGYAGEALRAVLAWGDQRFGEARTVCMIHPDNAPSLKLAARNGYREFQRTLYKGGLTILLERTDGA